MISLYWGYIVKFVTYKYKMFLCIINKNISYTINFFPLPNEDIELNKCKQHCTQVLQPKVSSRLFEPIIHTELQWIVWSWLIYMSISILHLVWNIEFIEFVKCKAVVHIASKEYLSKKRKSSAVIIMTQKPHEVFGLNPFMLSHWQARGLNILYSPS